ncbi:MAG: dihydroorotate dehydrogenase [Candidatus Melainabacteria bacterium HGW-Melainabacteria-1]|nr:MAG: dihydroorotate dehydrogenase [Candidatus Melainabacteria bacterium HGW-Melainabacteria-1]
MLDSEYLGLSLRSPLVAAASPLSRTVAGIEALAAAGAGAVVMHSLFEEQLSQDLDALAHYSELGSESYAEALSYTPTATQFAVGPAEYLDHLQAAKAKVDIPLIASLNGHTRGGWLDSARLIEAAGADALELNLYYLPTDPDRSGASIEAEYLDIVRQVRAEIKIPLAVKLSPFFSNLMHLSGAMATAGADALVLFNRFYQPDLNPETLQIEPHLLLSSPSESRLPMTWIGLLYGRVPLDLAASSGVHQTRDVLRMLMAGAAVVQLASVLLRRGPGYLAVLTQELREWLASHEYESVRQLRGSMSQLHCPDPSAFERVQYLRALNTFSH